MGFNVWMCFALSFFVSMAGVLKMVCIFLCHCNFWILSKWAIDVLLLLLLLFFLFNIKIPRQLFCIIITSCSSKKVHASSEKIWLTRFVVKIGIFNLSALTEATIRKSFYRWYLSAQIIKLRTGNFCLVVKYRASLWTGKVHRVLNNRSICSPSMCVCLVCLCLCARDFSHTFSALMRFYFIACTAYDQNEKYTFTQEPVRYDASSELRIAYDLSVLHIYSKKIKQKNETTTNCRQNASSQNSW